jgi:Protein of unknown function (DUF3318)
MHLQTYDSGRELEIQRLMTLLPDEMRAAVTIEPHYSGKTDLTHIHRLGRQCSLHLNFLDWQQFTLEQRNLLFWHEVAQIQGQKGQQSSQDKLVMGIGLFALFVELLSQNLIGVVTTLAITGLGGYHLYQQHRGERSLKRAAIADQDAMKLAVAHGYSAAKAYQSLYSALSTLARQKPQRTHWKQYQVRLRVLEILMAETPMLSSSTLPNYGVDVPYPVSSPCS